MASLRLALKMRMRIIEIFLMFLEGTYVPG
jgi:hypothetical protein